MLGKDQPPEKGHSHALPSARGPRVIVTACVPHRGRVDESAATAALGSDVRPPRPLPPLNPDLDPLDEQIAKAAARRRRPTGIAGLPRWAIGSAGLTWSGSQMWAEHPGFLGCRRGGCSGESLTVRLGPRLDFGWDDHVNLAAGVPAERLSGSYLAGGIVVPYGSTLGLAAPVAKGGVGTVRESEALRGEFGVSVAAAISGRAAAPTWRSALAVSRGTAASIAVSSACARISSRLRWGMVVRWIPAARWLSSG